MAEPAPDVIGPEARLDNGLFTRKARKATNSSFGQKHEDASYRVQAVSADHWFC